MKILKEGKWNVAWTTKINCPTCESELEVEESDVKPTYDSMEYQCSCAICKKIVKIPTKEIAQRVREAVDTKRQWSRGGWRD